MIRSWQFKTKLSASFAAVAGVSALSAGVAVYALRTVAASKDDVIVNGGARLAAAANVTAGTARQIYGFHGFLITPEGRLLEEFREGEKEVVEALRRLETLMRTEEQKRTIMRITEAHSDLTKTQERAVAIRTERGGFEPAARSFQNDTLPRRARLERELKSFVEQEQRESELERKDSTELASTAIRVLAALAGCVVVFGALCTWMLARALARHIGAAVQHVQSASAELQTAANQQASGAQEAATSISEVTTTISELLATSRQIADSARQVAQIAEETAAAARSGDQVLLKSQESIGGIRRHVDTIVNHMLELGRISQQIGGILDIVNELTEQTNILSINASIEAAGAGEHGRRFAVVGDEIRNLADRVSGSTKEMRGLVDEIRGAISTTVLATEGGSKAVDAGLRHFEEVTRGFKQIAGLVMTTTQAAREIELSTKQQSTAVEQVSSAITSAAEVSRETEASSSQMLQTATQLARLSHDLTQIVQPQAAA